MWNLIQTDKGKDILMMRDDFRKVRARMKQLQTSGRKNGRKVSYRVESTNETETFCKEPHGRVW